MQTTMKQVLSVRDAPGRHWVGDGFPVRSLFSYHGDNGARFSPFLLLDHAGPMEFEPAETPRGVGQHPHRGFETVTIVYQGEVEHRDSAGHGGTIGPGDVQWMTAASGIIHEEFHSRAFTRVGGTLEMVQLWVNLPSERKMDAPEYQSLLERDIPEVALPDGAGTLRVIAGDYEGQRGPARTATLIDVWDVRLQAGRDISLPGSAGYTQAVVVLHGDVQVNGGSVAGAGQLVELDREGSGFRLKADSDAVLLILGGEPIHEPVAGYGPFVMNTRDEIRHAVEDFNAGRFGSVA